MAQRARLEELEAKIRKLEAENKILRRPNHVKQSSWPGDIFNALGVGCSIYEVIDNHSEIDFILRGYNDFACKLNNIDRETLLDKSVYKLFKDTSLVDALKKTYFTGKTQRPPVSSYTIDKKTVWRENIYSPSLDGKHIIVVFFDITQQKNIENELQSELAFSTSVMNSLPGLFFVTNQEGQILRWNRNIKDFLGYSDAEISKMQPLDFFEYNHKKQMKSAFDNVFQSGSAGLEANIVSKNGTATPHLFTGTRTNLHNEACLIGMAINISNRKQAEESRLQLENKVQQAQKLESLAVLAGGIAHDFNNLLVGILGNAGLALMEIAPEAPATESIKDIEIAARRAAELARQMLAYSGKGRFVVKRLNLQKLLEEMQHLLSTSILKKIVVKYDFAANLPPIKADARQIRQVIMNLITNASEAIGDCSGVISIRTGACTCSAQYLNTTYLDDQLSAGVYTYLEVSDTGCGMDSETQSRIFDPFFSTKFTGRGLGLAAVLGIIRGHKGAIKINSQPGKGSTIKVLFPAIKDHLPGTLHPGQVDQQTAGLNTALNNKRILLVDDEETARTVGTKMLERFGMKVTTAEDGLAALSVFKRESAPFDLVLLDLTMPHLDGEETFREIQKIKPNSPVVLMSGYNEQELIVRFAGKGFAGFLQKPFNLNNLKDALLAAMQSKKASTV